MLKYEQSKMTRIMVATVHHVTSSSGLRKFPTNGFLSNRVYKEIPLCIFSLELYISFSDQLVSWNELNITKQGEIYI